MSRKAFGFAGLVGPEMEEEEFRDTTERAINELVKLKGIGPATASAILSAYSGCFPFMSDEAVKAFPSLRPIKYTLKHYLMVPFFQLRM